jgi:hypothetical protein
MNTEPKQIDNNKEEKPFEFYLEKYKQLDPKEVSERCNIPYNEETKEFLVRVMGYEYGISFPEFEIAPKTEDPDAYLILMENIPSRTFVMRYFIEGRCAMSSGRYITFREVPTYGELYLQPFTGRCISRLTYGFGYKLPKFKAAMEKLGATPIKMGDVAYEFELINNYHMRFIFWEADEEFPPSAQILYEDNFLNGFYAEDMVVAGDISITTVKGTIR